MRSFILRSVLAGATIAAAMVAPACTTTDRGGLYVILRTEMSVGDDIDNVQIRVIHAQRGEVARADVKLGLGGFFLPSSMAVAPSQSGKEGPYTIRVIGSLKGQPKTFREVVTDIPRTFLSSLEMPLEYLCYDQAKAVSSDAASTCPNGQTCTGGECAPIPTIDPVNLPKYDETSLGLTANAACFDARTCFAAPTLLDPNLDTCRVAKPAATYTLGLMLPASARGVPFMGKKLIAFDVDGPSGAREEAGQLVLPSGICRALRANPGALLVASTACTKRVVTPMCATSTDGGLPDADAADSRAVIDAMDVDATKDVRVVDMTPDASSEAPPDAGTDSIVVSIVDAIAEDVGTADAESALLDAADGPIVELDVASGGPGADAASDGGTAGRTVVCWGLNRDGQATPKPGAFTVVSSGGNHSCGMRSGGTVECWGSNLYTELDVPPVAMTSVSMGATHACGVRTDGSALCWGSNTSKQTEAPPGVFSMVSAGRTHSCGVLAAGTVACWGDNTSGKATPLGGTFTSVSAGSDHTCGVRMDGTMACWGNNSLGEATPMAGTFKAVGAGGGFTCALRTDSQVVCWGENDLGQTVAPAGVFDSLSVGPYHACAAKADGSVTCWGHNNQGQSTVPVGTFASVAAGNLHTCALTR